jgi:hypothetical protein
LISKKPALKDIEFDFLLKYYFVLLPKSRNEFPREFLFLSLKGSIAKMKISMEVKRKDDGNEKVKIVNYF